MTDPRQLLDDYATEKNFEPPMAFKPARTLYAPKAFAALRAVLGLHTETYYDRCKADDMTWPCATVQFITKALEAK